MNKRELLHELWALEKARPTKKIHNPEEVYPALTKYIDKKQEHFIVVTLNNSHEIIKVRSVTRGLLNKTMVHPREVFRPAIIDNAAAVILAHNHPSGSAEPSPEDREITRRLVKAGDLLGIQVLDHVIIARRGFYSFEEKEGL